MFFSFGIMIAIGLVGIGALIFAFTRHL